MSPMMGSETGISHKEWHFRRARGGDRRVRVKASIYSRTHELYLMKRVMSRYVNASGVLREKQTRRGYEGEVDVEAVEDATSGTKAER
jgi:hypothetical protein